jgi:hypothetical protein
VLDVDTSFAVALSPFDGRKGRADELLPRVDYTEATKVLVQLSACGNDVQIECGGY